MSNPGPLFWKDFQKRVASYIHDEHREVVELRQKVSELEEQVLCLDKYYGEYRELRAVLFRARDDGYENLEVCQQCKKFFIDEEEEQVFACECGNKVCNECSPDECDQCGDVVCPCCINYCISCNQWSCIKCEENIVMGETTVTGSIDVFCSEECKDDYYYVEE